MPSLMRGQQRARHPQADCENKLQHLANEQDTTLWRQHTSLSAAEGRFPEIVNKHTSTGLTCRFMKTKESNKNPTAPPLKSRPRPTHNSQSKQSGKGKSNAS